jgi:alpha-tubulin suppressor-like RCC1 family protein
MIETRAVWRVTYFSNGQNFKSDFNDGGDMNKSLFRNFIAIVSVGLGVALSIAAPSAYAVTQFSAGRSHSCAVTDSGAARCWGFNSNGQLGNGGTAAATSAVNVSGLTSGVTAVTTGNQHSCAVVNGGVKCWGINLKGQLGDGTNTQSLTPVDVSGLTTGVASISAGLEFTCAITIAGGVKCWGEGASGELGRGSIIDSNVPVDVTGLGSGVAAINAGARHACVRTTSGGAKCWGANSDGRLGDASNTQRLTPVDVDGLLSGVATIDAGWAHTCAVTTSGGAKCWGNNGAGQLGAGTTSNSNVPVDVSGLTTGVTSISAGGADNTFSHSCAVTTSGTLKCWGINSFGQLGNGTTTQNLTAVDVSGISSGATSVDAGSETSCALVGGALSCWGRDGLGNLGNGGANTNSSTPVAVVGLKSPQTISFAPISDKTFGAAPFSAVVSASSGLAVTLISFTPTVCTVSGLNITIIGAGTCNLNAGQPGDAIYEIAPEAGQSFNVAKAAQSITFAALADKTFADVPFVVGATTSSGLDPVFSSLTNTTCTVSGTAVTVVAAGQCTIAADQAGNGNYLAASQVAQSFNTAKAAQTISFDSPGSKTAGSLFDIGATSSSGLTVSIDTQTPTICTASGTSITLIRAGTCTLQASQGGNGNYNAASNVNQSFTVLSSGDGGGGGGCAMGNGRNADLTLALLCLFALWRVGSKRRVAKVA